MQEMVFTDRTRLSHGGSLHRSNSLLHRRQHTGRSFEPGLPSCHGKLLHIMYATRLLLRPGVPGCMRLLGLLNTSADVTQPECWPGLTTMQTTA